MTGVQMTIPFKITKKCSFYGTKNNVMKEDFSNATARDSSHKYTPSVKKIITLSSSESDSDSDVENTKVSDNAISVKTPQRMQNSTESDGMCNK